jgi:DNA-binding transcriptional MerR regulator/effector-binding domain-containing protein
VFTIGEFSRIAQVSGRLLRYYDDLGLFKPAKIDPETGYRFYSARQLPDLNRILALKELGLTLEQIAALSADISTEELRDLLVEKKAQIERTLRAELARVRYIESRIDQIDRDDHAIDEAVVLKSIAAHTLLGRRERSTTLAACRAAARDIGRQASALVDKKALGHFELVIYSDVWDANNLDVELGFILNQPPDGELALPGDGTIHVERLSAIELAATTVHVGFSEQGHCGYAALGRWAEANEHRFAGPAREVFVRPPHPGVDEDMVVEIQMPLKKIDNANGSSLHST